MQPFDYIAPRDFADASALLSGDGGTAQALQGGTDLLVRIRGGFVKPERVVDVKNLPGMLEIRQSPDGWLVIGAACTMNQVAAHPLVRRNYDLLVQACNSVASYQLRNRATVGGNCCNASPAADTAPALYCLDAMAQVYGPSGVRRLPIADFFTGPGRTALQPGELLTSIHLPPSPSGACGVFSKLGRTKIGDISIVSVAVYAWQVIADGRRRRLAVSRGGPAWPSLEWRIALGAAGPTPLRTPKAEAALAVDASPGSVALAADLAAQAARPISDNRASATYRRAMAHVLARRSIEAVMQQLESAA